MTSEGRRYLQWPMGNTSQTRYSCSSPRLVIRSMVNRSGIRTIPLCMLHARTQCRIPAKAILPAVPFFRVMRYDVYDFDDQVWACWDDQKGYLSLFMPKQLYQKWWFVHYGVLGRKLPGLHTIYRTDADAKEKMRIERHREQR